MDGTCYRDGDVWARRGREMDTASASESLYQFAHFIYYTGTAALAFRSVY